MPARDAADALRQLEAIGKRPGPPSKLVRELRKQVLPAPGLAITLICSGLKCMLLHGVKGTPLAVILA